MAHRVLSHTADTGVEATAETFAELLEELLEGMFASMADIESGTADTWVEAEVASETAEELVVDVLSEALYVSEVEDLILCDFRITEEGNRAELRMGGVPVGVLDVTGPPIKAVTYHGLVVQRDGAWYGRVYFDV